MVDEFKCKIIGIHGKAGSGKDTVCDYLLSKSPSICKYSFADPVKKMAAAMFGVPLKDFYNRTMKEKINSQWGISPRKMAQLCGTDMARNCFNDEIWLKRATIEIEHIRAVSPWVKYIIIPDVRFENEADYIRQYGGVLIHIDRPGQSIISTADHVSEQGIAPHAGDVMLLNNSNKHNLFKLIDKFFLDHLYGIINAEKTPTKNETSDFALYKN